MAPSVLEHLSQGNYNFLRPEPAEILRVVPAAEDRLPTPQDIFLEDETATPLTGFPILLSRPLKMLEATLGECLQAEEDIQFAFHNRETFDSRAYAAKWDRYRSMLGKISENLVGSSFGRNRFADVFWLHHSVFIARYLKEIPRRIRRLDLAIGREHGDAIKYKVFDKWIDRVMNVTYDAVHRVAASRGDGEDALFPAVLGLMRDNVLIFTEDHISPDLSELGSYFSGCLKTDGRDLRQRLAALEEWHAKLVASDELMGGAIRHLLRADPSAEASSLLSRPGYLSFLSHHLAYSTSRFPTEEQMQVWESLLVKLKEFEILHALRRMMVPIELQDGAPISRDRSVNQTWVGGPPILRLSEATRPIDFTSAWVVDPVVQRFGLVYDISDFSAAISLLGRAEKAAINSAFRKTFQFQRRVNQLAASLRLQLEKYLGDGAFYSCRSARPMLIAAIHLQRYYSEAVEKGFPFPSGLRIALNFGEYRLLPLDGGNHREARIEYFGHGLVELSRLSTGKKTQEIDEFKNYLIAQGYRESTVSKFFAPMLQQTEGLVSRQEQGRRFFAYINPNGTLINEGIVATESLVGHLGTFEKLYFGKDSRRGYIVLTLEEDSGATLLVGIRKLGIGKFKGLEPMPIYELVDGADWQVEDLQPVPSQPLLGALDRLFAQTMTRGRQKPATSPAAEAG